MISSDDGRPSGDSNRSESDVSENDRSGSEGDAEDGTSKQETLHEPGSSRSGYSMSESTLSGISSMTGSVGCSRCNTPECDHILPRENLSRRNQGVELSETSLTSSDLVTRTGRVVKTSQ